MTSHNLPFLKFFEKINEFSSIFWSSTNLGSDKEWVSLLVNTMFLTFICIAAEPRCPSPVVLCCTKHIVPCSLYHVVSTSEIPSPFGTMATYNSYFPLEPWSCWQTEEAHYNGMKVTLVCPLWSGMALQVIFASVFLLLGQVQASFLMLKNSLFGESHLFNRKGQHKNINESFNQLLQWKLSPPVITSLMICPTSPPAWLGWILYL